MNYHRTFESWKTKVKAECEEGRKRKPLMMEMMTQKCQVVCGRELEILDHVGEINDTWRKK
jgi:hypothetical protein